MLLQRNYNIKEKLIRQWATLRFLQDHDMLGQLPDSRGNHFSDKEPHSASPDMAVICSGFSGHWPHKPNSPLWNTPSRLIRDM